MSIGPSAQEKHWSDCPKCGTPTRMQVQATLSAPATFSHNLTKANLRGKDVSFMGVYWETQDLICPNPICMHFTNGYGNFVTRLQKQNDELIKALRIIGSQSIGPDWTQEQAFDFIRKFAKETIEAAEKKDSS